LLLTIDHRPSTIDHRPSTIDHRPSINQNPPHRRIYTMAVDEARLDADKRKALNLAISQIEKQIGRGAIMRMGSDRPRVRVAAISTGAINLDAATGIGGVPRGRITEIYGPESSGKTTLCLHLVANVQRTGGVAAYVDAEHALDVDYAKRLGVDIENLLVSQPDTGEQALEIVEILVRSGAVDLVVIDSVAALVPKAEIEGEMGDSHMGLQARLMSQALRKLAGAINRTNCAVVFINQLREKIGVMFGNPETTTGGKALKFYASLRMDIRRIGPVKERDAVIGSHVRVKVVKNKVAPPFKQAEFDVMFDEGISHTGLIVDIASEAGIIQKSGAWYSYGDQRIGQGRENAKLFLKDNAALLTEIEAKVRESLGVGTATAPAAEEEDAE
jgi:recombination protein RecA